MIMSESAFDFQAEFCKVVGHPVRLQILQVLRKNAMNVSEMIRQTGLSRSMVSRQLHVLRAAGVVNCQRQGLGMRYQLTDQRTAEVCDLVYGIISENSKRQIQFFRK